MMTFHLQSKLTTTMLQMQFVLNIVTLYTKRKNKLNTWQQHKINIIEILVNFNKLLTYLYISLQKYRNTKELPQS